MQQQPTYQGQNVVRENFGECPAQAEWPNVPETSQTQTPCASCTSIYMAIKDRSPYDRAFLRAYNRLPAQYNTQLESLIFAP